MSNPYESETQRREFIMVSEHCATQAKRIAELEHCYAIEEANHKSSLRRIAELEAELKRINDALADPRTDLTMTAAEVIKDLKATLANHTQFIPPEFQAEMEALRKDAERYRRHYGAAPLE